MADPSDGQDRGENTAHAVQLAASVLFEALSDNGVEYVFGNAGTDFAPLIEALSAERAGLTPFPVPVMVPHENVAVCMAQGVTLATGRPQAVILHVNVGTANAICGLINASRERIPIFLAAGRTPVLEGGRRGARSAFIHWGQEMFDQAGMVREIVKWDYELRYPEQAGLVVDRAMAVAMASPQGPVYVTLPREVLASEVSGAVPRARRTPATPATLAPGALDAAREILAPAQRPLLVCSSLGRTEAEYAALMSFAEAQQVGVVPYRTRFAALPSAHSCHLGHEVGPHIGLADLVIAAESDVPWIPSNHALAPEAKVVHLGSDPEYQRYPMRNFRNDLTLVGDAAQALDVLAAAPVSEAVLAARRAFVAERRQAFLDAVAATPMPGPQAPATTAWIARCLGEVKRSSDRVVVEIPFPIAHMEFSEPGGYFQTPSAGGLGWVLGASLGLKLADRSRRIISVVGDGSYMFGNPTPAHMLARALELPTLTVIINNRMWAAVRRATLGLYPDGAAAASNRTPLTYLEPSPDYEKVVEASGGYGEKVERAGDLPGALERALAAVDGDGRPAVLNVLTAYSDADARRDALV